MPPTGDRAGVFLRASRFLVGTLGFSLRAALVMAAVSLKSKHRADTIIGVLWARRDGLRGHLCST